MNEVASPPAGMSLIAHSRVQVLFLIVLCILSVILIYGVTSREILTAWLTLDESMSHGLLVAATCIYLIHRVYEVNSMPQVNAVFVAFLPLVLTSFAWVIAQLAGINLIAQLILPLLLIFSVLLVLGYGHTKLIFVPVLFLYFAIPVWDYLNNYVLAITVFVVQNMVKWTDITAYIEGSSIFLPHGEILIASGCSGLRYFIVASFLSCLSAYMYYSKWSFRVALVVMCLLLSLIANWLRVYGITLIADITRMQSPIIKDHETLGWVLFMIFMLPLFYINYRYAEPEPSDRAPTVKEANSSALSMQSSKQLLLAIVLLLAGLYSGPLIIKLFTDGEVSSAGDLVQLPDGDGYWYKKVLEQGAFEWKPNFKTPESYLFQSYSNNETDLGLFVFSYHKTGVTGDILPYVKKIYDHDRWALTQSNSEKVIGENAVIPYKIQVVTNKVSSERVVLASTFNIGGRTTTSYKLGKLYQIPAVLSKKPFATITVLTTRCKEKCSKEIEEVKSFMSSRLPLIHSGLPEQ